MKNLLKGNQNAFWESNHFHGNQNAFFKGGMKDPVQEKKWRCIAVHMHV